MGTATGIIIGVLILSIMMIVHEFGHYWTGRRLGFKIEEFSIFMGPVLFSWERNQIKYSLKLLPIGASVRFAGEYGEEGEESKDPRVFYNKPKWARCLVVGTGPVLNLISGAIALLLMFSIFGYSIPVLSSVVPDTLAATAGLAAGDRVLAIDGHSVNTTLDYQFIASFVPYDNPITIEVRHKNGQIGTFVLQPRYEDRYRLGITIDTNSAVISSVEADSNQGHPVLQAGDTLVAAQGVPYSNYEQFAAAVENSAGQAIVITVIRGGKTLDLTMVATKYNDPVPSGIYFASSKAFGPAVEQSLLWPWSIIKATLRSIGMLFAGTVKPQDALSGPVGVVTMITDVVQQKEPISQKIFALLWLFALVSVSLGFMNLLPIPPLDGNHLVLIGIEAVRGKRLSLKAQNIIGLVGVAIIVVLALAGLFFDVLRLINRA
jgi:regulator of sigma E protease